MLLVQQCLADSFTERVDQEFEKFKQKYNVQYAPNEESYRREVFSRNFQWIEEQNARGDLTYALGVTRFCDRTNKEFTSTAAGLEGSVDDLKSQVILQSAAQSMKEDPPQSVNWVKRGVVGPVKDQGECGSCASFATAGALESYYAMATGHTNDSIVPLSEQQILDCYASASCNGGLPSGIFTYVKDNGITSEKNYPYEASKSRDYNEPCRTNLLDKDDLIIKPGIVTGYTTINGGDYQGLLSAVAFQGPVATLIDGTTPPFQHYKSGVITGVCDKVTLHIVVIVGYGETSEGIKYWLIKNSWGTEWGENGYGKVERDTGGFGRH
ncbi:cryptopain precursor, putative [Perkinsus marinus ATCC 50983]|uniref:Cryptopain, putative n=1 Tax=Perkinsus marinus (strain ATCC 50983 / TXsc) TaxID=423536 RepID=C5L2W0_PERM5|nr:cryptopain precursor, putative [Perkinsus marinus ATCC 50983]EER08933.1 cryptopain precursor, putative [Perkinsus marinus ATCC 50983]|eukprot:XP_002777117.1 cryptopain precursor, putative [Perkinsus marinus ATCC 50983]